MPKQFRNVSDDDRVVKYGVVGHAHGVLVPVDGLVNVEDHAIKSYECQPSMWKADGDHPVEKFAPDVTQDPEPYNEEA